MIVRQNKAVQDVDAIWHSFIFTCSVQWNIYRNSSTDRTWREHCGKRLFGSSRKSHVKLAIVKICNTEPGLDLMPKDGVS